ncbi:hypothetical protein O6H91_11G053500 [Diphasiastrum complanatum]|uniref:Uncharacterized protein n=3 Tax=Diphasiastrum complanatum TaxID=34168 RepID=A0ACC2C923_DIPCM|nr:hypothetical protein O6H91_11G053500 [Diphasiastrum complanatum]KAJ7538541.1 hypothetical protein O6H91_11G053500 [Diphasiastrum complanatum]KAJ7538542.1 hypothetical protein O6H91_11G053500 [Diphasiastrum complanatum]
MAVEKEIQPQQMPQTDDFIFEPLLRKELPQQKVGFNLSKRSSHRAMIGANISPIESLDYEIVANELLNQDWRTRAPTEKLQYTIGKWVLAFMVGLFTGVVAFSINMAVENLAGVKFLATVSLMDLKRTLLAYALYTGSNMLLVLLSAMLCIFIAPAAAGSGIPEVKAYLNGLDIPEAFAGRTLLVKIFGSIGSVASGLVCGKAGPLVHIGACIAFLLGQGNSKVHILPWNWLVLLDNDRDRRDLVTCGAAAGLAAAFRSPVGGVLFALEEAASWWRNSLLWRTFFTTAVVAVVLRTGMSSCKNGACGLFGEGGLILFNVSEQLSSYGFLELIAITVLGVLGGVSGSLYNQLHAHFFLFNTRWQNRKGSLLKLAHAGMVAFVTSTCSFGLPWLVQCRACPDNLEVECPTHGRIGNFKAFNCPHKQYNDLAGLVFNTSEDSIRNLFSIDTPLEFHYTSLLIFLVTSYTLALLTYGILVPSGLFVPAILFGATYGRLTGMFMVSHGLQRIDEGIYAVLGAASFLGGSMRMTVTLCVILLELTNNLTMLPLVMLVLLIAKVVGDLFNDAIFKLHVRMKGIPFLDILPEQSMQQLTARDVITKPLMSFSRIEQVQNIVETLQGTGHNAFPVIDSCSPDKVLLGIVLRSHILLLLKTKSFQLTNGHVSVIRLPFSEESRKPFSTKEVTLEDIDLSTQEMLSYVDLHPVINTSPYTVMETMPLTKVYALFRQLGLRHVCVLPRDPKGPPITGILTRHDFMNDHLLQLYPDLRQTKKRTLSSFSNVFDDQ